ncbi:MAG: cupin domain-containing protein [Deltaproteobacteria bacterium]|nr:MAG: cupin domain-containing protein [Deltaproteobacteria bacterium]
MEVTIAGETRVAGPGCAAVVPLNTSHAVRARTDARTIVVDHPRRHRIGGVETR